MNVCIVYKPIYMHKFFTNIQAEHPASEKIAEKFWKSSGPSCQCQKGLSERMTSVALYRSHVSDPNSVNSSDTVCWPSRIATTLKFVWLFGFLSYLFFFFILCLFACFVLSFLNSNTKYSLIYTILIYFLFIFWRSFYVKLR